MRGARAEAPERPMDLERVGEAVDALTLGAGRLEEAPLPRGTRVPGFTEVVVGVDETPASRRAAAWGGAVAAAGGRARALSVAPPVGLGMFYLDQLARAGDEGRMSLLEQEEQTARRLAAGAADAIREQGGSALAEVARGAPARELLARAEECGADLVVVGDHGGSAVERALLGSVAEGVLRRCRRSVLVARGEPPPRRVLLPVDGSGASKLAAAAGLGLARRLGAEVTLLHAVDPPAFVPVEELTEVYLEAARRTDLRDWGTGAEAAVVFGRPGERIVEAAQAKGCGLVVVGRAGLGGVPGSHTGSVSGRVAREAPVAVLVVKERLG